MNLVHSRRTADIGQLNEKSKKLGPEGWLSCDEPKVHREGMLGGGQAWAKAQAAGKPSSEVREGGSPATAKIIVVHEDTLPMQAGVSTSY